MVAAPRHSASGGARQRQVAKARLKQSVCRWPFAKIPLPAFCTTVADMGLTAIDLLTESEWPVAREYGLTCSMGSGFGGTIVDGLNVKANHAKTLASLERGISPRGGEQGAEPHHANDPPFDELVVVVVVRNPRELFGGDQTLVSRHGMKLHGVLTSSSRPEPCRSSLLGTRVGVSQNAQNLRRIQVVQYAVT